MNGLPIGIRRQPSQKLAPMNHQNRAKGIPKIHNLPK